MEVQVLDISRQQDDIVEEFAQLPDWSDKYEYLVDMGKRLPPIADSYKTDAYLVKGCQSKVWLHGEVKGGRLFLEADSDTVITKGIIALLIRVFSGQKVEEIQNSDIRFIDSIGLKSHLSPTRSNGLVSMINYIKSYANRQPGNRAEAASQDLSGKRQLLIEELKKVYDPEIPVDIYELGLIYQLEVDAQGKVTVVMTLTSPACPVAGSLPLEIQQRLSALDFVTEVDLKLVWTPAWSKERMSDEARMALDMF